MMSKKEFIFEMRLMLTLREQAMINPQIYYNPDYVDYYINYHSEMYEECLDTLYTEIELLRSNKITNNNLNRETKRELMKKIRILPNEL